MLSNNNLTSAEILRINNKKDKDYFNLLINNKNTQVYDSIQSQLKDLIQIRHPASILLNTELNELVKIHLGTMNIDEYGVWVYYPWSNRLVHLLPEEEFIEVRTNRNLYKITPQERELLAKKRIGIIGLSVGQSVALTIALERTAGELIIADFDQLELSNLNRIRTGLHNIGLRKTEIVAREIAEIDPFIKITCFTEGINTDNLNQFLTQSTPLDLLIDECDSLPIKILCRKSARALKIPVLMDTSDRGMLDIERFDLEPQREIFHGLLVNIENIDFKNLSEEHRLSILAKIVGVKEISSRLKASVLEMNQSIKSWPQLASSVVLGGAIVAETARRILLKEPVKSGRFYIDLSEIILEKTTITSNKINSPNQDEQWNEIINYSLKNKNIFNETINQLTEDTIQFLISYACKAPSSGNNQPWLWLYRDNILFLSIDKIHTQAFGDFLQIPSYIALGAAIENLTIASESIGLKLISKFCNLEEEYPLVAYFGFVEQTTNDEHQKNLLPIISKRFTNRGLFNAKPIADHILLEIEDIVKTFGYNSKIQFLKKKQEIETLGNIVAEMDRLRLLHPQGHQDFFNNELRWSKEEAELRGDGIDLKSLELSSSNLLGVKLLSDPNVASLLNNINGGSKLLDSSKIAFSNTDSIIFLTLPRFSMENFLLGGILMQKIWIYCTSRNIAVHPIVSPLYFFYRHLYGQNNSLNEKEIINISKCRNQFSEIFNCNPEDSEIIMFRMGYSDHQNQLEDKIRRPLGKVLKIITN
ncbi:MAG: Rv1355c family protein [Cytophagales bacterium]|nr:MAG: Rv1355c family protein [Cytophagales bacterium]